MTIQYLLTALLISLVTTAIHVSTWPDMIFHKPAKDLEALVLSLCKKEKAKVLYLHRIDIAICKPLFRCLICMSSFWGLIAWAVLRFVYGYYFNPVLLILLVCGINTLITSIISNLLPDDE